MLLEEQIIALKSCSPLKALHRQGKQIGSHKFIPFINMVGKYVGIPLDFKGENFHPEGSKFFSLKIVPYEKGDKHIEVKIFLLEWSPFQMGLKTNRYILRVFA